MAHKRMKGWELCGLLPVSSSSRFVSAHTKSEARAIFKKRLFGKLHRLPHHLSVIQVLGD